MTGVFVCFVFDERFFFELFFFLNVRADRVVVGAHCATRDA